MRYVNTPRNEERKQAAAIVLEPERFPVKHLAIRPLARTGPRTFEFNSILAQSLGELLQVVAMRRPPDEARLLQLGDHRVLLHPGLFGIGRDDFQVAAGI